VYKLVGIFSVVIWVGLFAWSRHAHHRSWKLAADMLIFLLVIELIALGKRIVLAQNKSAAPDSN